ncbi:hypothetical protein LSH36_265g01029 [Paralvinella palmiformis]|uniref:DRBM domain-containing protein n=1 Tax=Paralvinella palmiformis TaxID=53620 RepID=A0AAD9N514_9ANNE|nr:hypothetical protein LSH36_265g01029 [Paralvinella palmiformis]
MFRGVLKRWFIQAAEDSPIFTGDDSIWQQHKQTPKSPSSVSQPDVHPKDAISILNELYRGPTYELGQRESPDSMVTATLNLEGQVFKAEGHNKKEAKQEVARRALDSLKAQGIFQMREKEQFEAKKRKMKNSQVRWQEMKQEQNVPLQVKIELSEQRDRKNIPLLKNAIMTLNDRFKALPYNIISETGSMYSKTFTICVTVQGKNFIGSGRTKQKAKLVAAEKALRAFDWWTDEDEKTKRAIEEQELHQQISKLKCTFVDFHLEGGETQPVSVVKVEGQGHGRRGAGTSNYGQAVNRFGDLDIRANQWGRGGHGAVKGRGQYKTGGRGSGYMNFTKFQSGGTLYNKPNKPSSSYWSNAPTSSGNHSQPMGTQSSSVASYDFSGQYSRFGYSGDMLHGSYPDYSNMTNSGDTLHNYGNSAGGSSYY